MKSAATALAVLLLLVAPAPAEVADAAPNGFTSVHTADFAAGPEAVFESVVLDWGKWWDPAHSFFGDAGNFRVDATVGGGWFEVHPDGRWVKHLDVVFVDPGRQLRMRGGLGPLQGMAVTGALTWQFEATGPGTRVTLTYAVGGYAPQGLDTLAPVVDRVIGEQLMRLKGHLEP